MDMGSSGSRRTYKPRGAGGGRSSSRGGGTRQNRRYRPSGRGSQYNQFRHPRHHRNQQQYQHNKPIKQGDGTWYDPSTGEYFRRETLFDMLKRWFSALTGKKS